MGWLRVRAGLQGAERPLPPWRVQGTAAQAGSLPWWRVKKKPPDGAGGFGISIATEDVLGNRQGFSFGGFLCEADKVPTVRPFKKVEQ